MSIETSTTLSTIADIRQTGAASLSPAMRGALRLLVLDENRTDIRRQTCDALTARGLASGRDRGNLRLSLAGLLVGAWSTVAYGYSERVASAWRIDQGADLDTLSTTRLAQGWAAQWWAATMAGGSGKYARGIQRCDLLLSTLLDRALFAPSLLLPGAMRHDCSTVHHVQVIALRHQRTTATQTPSLETPSEQAPTEDPAMSAHVDCALCAAGVTDAHHPEQDDLCDGSGTIGAGYMDCTGCSNCAASPDPVIALEGAPEDPADMLTRPVIRHAHGL